MGALDGKVAVITGGSSGIGLATARRFAREGARVFITGRRRDALDAAVRELGTQAEGVMCDVTITADVVSMYQHVQREAGGVDVVVANAGVGAAAPFGKSTAELIDTVMGTNVSGTIYTVEGALPHLRPGASIILTGSTAAVRPDRGLEVYAASKAAVRALSRGWALHAHEHHFRVNVVSPGGTRTDGLLALVTPEVLRDAEAKVPLNRLADPDEIAAVTTFLASDASSYVNGAEYFVDGGFAQV